MAVDPHQTDIGNSGLAHELTAIIVPSISSQIDRHHKVHSYDTIDQQAKDLHIKSLYNHSVLHTKFSWTK